MCTGHVVDSSVLVAALVDTGSDGTWSEQVISGGFLASPHLAIVEALNILRRLELADQLTELEAASAQRDLHELEIDLLPARPFEERIWQLRQNLTCYDAWYVAVAEALRLPLATLDRRMVRAPGPQCEIVCPDRDLPARS
jgi:predicted nucleic acid-binding protein